jgi:hypothetical protein
MSRPSRAWALIGAVGLSACTTTYTESDLEAEERRQDDEVSAESARDEKLGEEGGANREALDEERERMERENDL